MAQVVTVAALVVVIGAVLLVAAACVVTAARHVRWARRRGEARVKPALALAGVASMFAVAALVGHAGSSPRPLYKGRTAEQWYGRAVTRHHQADDLQQRLTKRVLETRQLRRALSYQGGTLEQRFAWLTRTFGGCIHGREGSWTDPNAPYWGGLQADLDFMRTWAPELYRRYGTADRWTPTQQVAMAILAWTERGFRPWPRTSRACGVG